MLRAIFIALMLGLRPLARAWPHALWILPCLALGATDAEANVTRNFQTAAQLYRAGKLKAAYKILRGIVKKYPAHHASNALIGRILFRQGKVNAAIKYFKKIPPSFVTSDFAYEYGIAMFQANEYNKAIKGFGKVPKKSKLAGLAYFYAGVSYFRLKRYTQALNLLRRASPIPASLASAHRNLIEQARQRQRLEFAGQVPQANPYVIVPSPPPPLYPGDPSAPAAAPGAPKKEEPPPPPPPPQSGFANSITPGIDLTQRQDTYDFYGFGTKTADTQSVNLSLGLEARYNASPRPFGGQPYLSLGVTGAQSRDSVRTRLVKNVASADDPTAIREDVTETSATTTTGSLSATPEAGYPITESLDVAVGYGFSETYPDMQAEGKTTEAGPSAKLNISLAGATMALSAKQTETTVDGGTPSSRLNLKGDLDKSFGSLSFGFLVEQNQYSSPAGANPVSDLKIQADGSKTWDSFSMTLTAAQFTATPAEGKPILSVSSDYSNTLAKVNRLDLSLGVNIPFDFGGAASATFKQSTESQVTLEVDDPKAAEPAEGETKPKVYAKGTATLQEFNGTLKLSPLDWISGSLSYVMVKGQHTAGDPAFQKNFELFAETVSTLTIKVSLSTTF